MAAGSPVCDCQQPSSCFCKAEVISNINPNKTFSIYPTYSSENTEEGIIFYSPIYLYDKEGQGAEIKIKALSKGCVGGHSDCPSGFITRLGTNHLISRVPTGVFQTYILKYDDSSNYGFDIGFSNNSFNIVTIIMLMLMDKIRGDLPHTNYGFDINECQNLPLATNFYQYNGTTTPFSTGSFLSAFRQIKVYPPYKTSVEIAIGLQSEVEHLTADQRRALMQQQNRTQHPNAGHSGWTRRTQSISIKNSLSISGTAKYKIANREIEYSSDTLKAEFTRYRNKLKLLDRAEQALSVVGSMFTSVRRDNTVKPTFSMEFLYPKIVFSGEDSLDFNTTTTLPYRKLKASVGLSPLIGLKCTVDLIQAFAAYYGLHYLVSAVRTVGSSAQERVKAGGDGAYISGNFDLIIEGSINITFAVESDENEKFSFQFDDLMEGKLSISAEANIQGGVKFYFAKGYFAAGGNVTAEGCFGLERKEQTMDIVFYHNGVLAKFWAEAGAGEYVEQTQRPKTSTNGNGVITAQRQETISGTDGTKYNQSWQIIDKLEKKNSDYRISFEM